MRKYSKNNLDYRKDINELRESNESIMEIEYCNQSPKKNELLMVNNINYSYF